MTPLQSTIVSHFLLNLRQLSRSTRCDMTDTGRGESHTTSIQFASFIDNMGEQVDHVFEHLDPASGWLDEDCSDADGETGADPPHVPRRSGSSDTALPSASGRDLKAEDTKQVVITPTVCAAVSEGIAAQTND
ncbi:hypothetical protein OBBRIDRAFT_329746 [Obba rivulosa]|uniref:Uncharacterized protein n=1 Tax=Obba rivulosa TaxID=1052685 RepID=A0A8E2DGW2_9APHY|nr:hypothetical protein OBBRIDRAFT_329746 [Obba rivulosa]